MTAFDPNDIGFSKEVITPGSSGVVELFDWVEKLDVLLKSS